MDVRKPHHTTSFWVSVMISIAALALAFYGVQPASVLGHLRNVQPGYVLLALLLILLGLGARARSWQILLGGQHHFGRVFAALNAGYLLNTVLPLRLGEIARAYLVSDDEELGFGWRLSTVFWERLIDALVCFSGFVVVLPAFFHINWVRSLTIIVSIVIVVVIGGVALLARLQTRLLDWVTRLMKQRFAGILHLLEDFLQGMSLIREYRRILHAAIWSLLAWITAWLGIQVLLAMFGLEPDWRVALFVSGAVAFSAAVPSLPGAIGVYELSAVAGFLVFGYPQDVCISMALVNHFFQLGLTAILGALALAGSGNTISGITRKLQNSSGRKAKQDIP